MMPLEYLKVGTGGIESMYYDGRMNDRVTRKRKGELRRDK